MSKRGISSCLRRRSPCPIHGGPISCRRHASTTSSRSPILTSKAAKALIPTMQDLVLWKGDNVTVAMSGGVDSAVALRILAEFPLNLQVIFMRNWDAQLSEMSDDEPTQTSYAYSKGGPSGRSNKPNMSPCGWEKDWESVQEVCAHVGIPSRKVKLVDLSREYWARVFEPALNVWESGGTPNPDVACNREIKFGALLQNIPKTARSFLATGHYARVKRVPHATRLVRPADATKDQTYYLSSLLESQLRRAITPLGEITKTDVRKLAKFYGLPNADNPESMGLCFVGERGKFSKFISQYMPKPPTQGYLVDSEGKRLSTHDGLWSYTIGQKANIAGCAEKMFIAKKGVGETGQDILVVPGSDHPALFCTKIRTHDFHWIAGKVPKGFVPGDLKAASIVIRHRMEPIKAMIAHDWTGNALTLYFLEPVHGVAPGQVCAIYYEKWCLGSGIIKETWTSDVNPIKSPKALKLEFQGKDLYSMNDLHLDENGMPRQGTEAETGVAKGKRNERPLSNLVQFEGEEDEENDCEHIGSDGFENDAAESSGRAERVEHEEEEPKEEGDKSDRAGQQAGQEAKATETSDKGANSISARPVDSPLATAPTEAGHDATRSEDGGAVGVEMLEDDGTGSKRLTAPVSTDAKTPLKEPKKATRVSKAETLSLEEIRSASVTGMFWVKNNDRPTDEQSAGPLIYHQVDRESSNPSPTYPTGSLEAMTTSLDFWSSAIDRSPDDDRIHHLSPVKVDMREEARSRGDWINGPKTSATIYPDRQDLLPASTQERRILGPKGQPSMLHSDSHPSPVPLPQASAVARDTSAKDCAPRHSNLETSAWDDFAEGFDRDGSESRQTIGPSPSRHFNAYPRDDPFSEDNRPFRDNRYPKRDFQRGYGRDQGEENYRRDLNDGGHSRSDFYQRGTRDDRKRIDRGVGNNRYQYGNRDRERGGFGINERVGYDRRERSERAPKRKGFGLA